MPPFRYARASAARGCYAPARRVRFAALCYERYAKRRRAFAMPPARDMLRDAAAAIFTPAMSSISGAAPDRDIAA